MGLMTYIDTLTAKDGDFRHVLYLKLWMSQNGWYQQKNQTFLFLLMYNKWYLTHLIQSRLHGKNTGSWREKSKKAGGQCDKTHMLLLIMLRLADVIMLRVLWLADIWWNRQHWILFSFLISYIAKTQKCLNIFIDKFTKN